HPDGPGLRVDARPARGRRRSAARTPRDLAVSDYDRELLALLRTLPPEEVANVIETLPYSSIQPLLGLLGSGDGREMPASPLQQARELDPKYVTRPHLEVLSDAIVEAIGRTRAG